MAFTTNPYCTLAQVKSALDLQKTTQDTWIQELIEEAQGAVDRYIGYPFQTDGTSAAPAQRVYDGNDMEELFIDYCLSISQVKETTYNVVLGSQGIYQLATTQTVDITSDVYLLPNNSLAKNQPFYKLRRLSGYLFGAGHQNYVVSGIFGYPSIPADISRATTRLAVHYYKMRDTNYADLLAEQGAVRQKYTKPMPDDVVEILERYKHRNFLCR